MDPPPPYSLLKRDASTAGLTQGGPSRPTAPKGSRFDSPQNQIHVCIQDNDPNCSDPEDSAPKAKRASAVQVRPFLPGLPLPTSRPTLPPLQQSDKDLVAPSPQRTARSETLARLEEQKEQLELLVSFHDHGLKEARASLREVQRTLKAMADADKKMSEAEDRAAKLFGKKGV